MSCGVKVITYAVRWIRQSITHAIAEHGGVIALPVKHLEKLRHVLEGYRRYTQQIGVEPSSEELAVELELRTPPLSKTAIPGHVSFSWPSNTVLANAPIRVHCYSG